MHVRPNKSFDSDAEVLGSLRRCRWLETNCEVGF